MQLGISHVVSVFYQPFPSRDDVYRSLYDHLTTSRSHKECKDDTDGYVYGLVASACPQLAIDMS